MRKLFGMAALAVALVAVNSASRAAEDIESCPPAPVIEDPQLRENLDGKREYIKWMATTRDDARQAMAAMLEAYSPGRERQLATEAVLHMICVMVKDPNSDLSSSQREVLGALVPAGRN